ncbi:MAG: PAS domain S-box protein, partial [Desulfuromusa sp.]|nr:PAS domain S-box protein [Desulfuromusa sp.]
MKIKTRIQVSITLCIVLVMTIGLFVFMAIREVNDKSREAKVVAIIVKHMAELNTTTHEYLLHRGERSLVQWKLKYDSLANRLTREENKFESPDEKISLNKIHRNLVRLGTAFSKLTTDFENERGLDRQKDPISSELQDRLIGELLIKSQATVSPVFHLQRVINDEIEVAQISSSILIYIFLVVFMFLVVGTLIWIKKSVARPIIILEEGTQIIGAGNLSHKVGTEAKDEIGALSRSFDKMTEDLKKSTTSIVDLNKEIVERKQSDNALRESEERYRNIFENIQDVYYEASMDGTILEISPSIENISKYKREELIGKSLYDIYTDPKEREKLISVILDSGKVANFEVHLTDKDGSPHSVELNTTLYRDQKGKPIKIIGSMRDISERKQLESRLRQSQKMEAIGSLAGGTAHEFNNILGTIIGNTALALNDVPESNPARECLEEIQSASLRAKNVVRQLLGFARKSVFQLIPVQISPIVSETLKLIRASISATIEIRQDLSCKSDTVMADTVQINQVLINLCTNAKNAMQEKGGVLEVKLEDTVLDEKSATRYEDLSPGNYVKLIVKDSGHGIDPKIITRIFDPYFTTTSLAEGIGMSLAVVHGIVKHHNGAITVASEPGKGAAFEVLFPLTEAEAEQEAGELEALPAGNENILFVDDEASLAKM